MRIFSCIFAGIACLGLMVPGYSYDDKKAPEPKVVKMEEIKQELVGLDKEYTPGKMIKVKISNLPKTANQITAVYKLTLLENGKKSTNCEVLTRVERNTEDKKDSTDFVFAAECSKSVKYQVLFAVTYIEQKPDTKEIVNVYNPDISVYDVKIAGIPDVPDVDIVPDGPNGFIKLVYTKCMEVNVDAAKRKTLFTNLANSFSGMSSKIAAGVFKDSANEDEQIAKITEFLKQTKEENNKAMEQSGVDKLLFEGTLDVAIQTKLSALLDSGKMKRFSEYQAVWGEISEGYRLAAKK